jgi:hypothetical protein
VADFCEYGNKHSVSMKGGEFIDYLNDIDLLMKETAQ